MSVYEVNRDAGGFFRSARMLGDDGMPSEYSWHGFGPWYHNTFDVMAQIPFDESGSVYDKGLTRPIDFGLAPDKGTAQFNDGPVIPVSKMFRMSGLDSLRWSWLLLKTWAANRRTLRALLATERCRAVETNPQRTGMEDLESMLRTVGRI